MTAGISQTVGNRGLSDYVALQIARGQIGGHRAITRGGINSDIDSGAFESLWEQGGLYAFPPAASIMTISSTSAADAAAGTGARTVLVTGLDANYVEISEVVTLNGQTPVNTVNQYLRAHGMTVLTAGSGGTAAGTIYQGTGAVVAGVPAVVYALIALGWNTSQGIAYTIPAGHTGYLVDLVVSSISSATNQNSQLSIRQRSPGGVFLRGGTLVIAGGLLYIPFVVPRRFDEKTDIDVVVITTDTNVTATAAARLILVSNSLGD